MQKEEFDIAVLGAGPGGYIAAIRAAQRGARVALIEEKQLGGTCLNCGCIPSKALIASAEIYRHTKEAAKHGIELAAAPLVNYAKMQERKRQVVERLRKGLEGLIASHKIKIFRGRGKFVGENEIKILQTEVAIQAKKIIIATGSESRSLAVAAVDGVRIHNSTSLLELETLPKSLLIVGGGVIGCEFASLMQELEVKVTLIELLPEILATEGKDVSAALTVAFKKRGIIIETSATVQKLSSDGQQVQCSLGDGRLLEADMALVSVGRSYNSADMGLEKCGVLVQDNGAIAVNDEMQTNRDHIYAIGDVTGKWLLAHVASHQGVVAADHAMGLRAHMRYHAIPSVTFTHPEVATVGLTLEKALSLGIDAKIGRFPFQALGRALATLETEGFAQVVIDKKTSALIGAQVVGAAASTLIAEMAVAIENELVAESIAETIHAHPTASEAWLEAALGALGLSLHLPKMGS